MNAHRSRPARPRRKGGFRPRLEPLEHRWCPSCLTRLDDGTLFILGDNAANAIAVRDDGARGVTVRCGRDEARRFLDVRRIVLRGGGGDDRISYLQSNPNETPADLQLDLGRGNDFLTIACTNPSNDKRDPGRPVVFEVAAGPDDDRVAANFINLPAGDFVFRADLGGHDDTLSVNYIPVEQVVPRRL